MKKIIIVLAAVLLTATAFAQTPGKMSYQAVVRNSSDQLLTNQGIGMQISILLGSTTGTAVYTETQTATTNVNGLVTIVIGNGTTSDDFSAIDWANGSYFIKTEIDPTTAGGIAYTIIGTSQLLSVPYALTAKNVENDQVDDADADPTNELDNTDEQSLSFNSGTGDLTISNGNTVNIPTGDATPGGVDKSIQFNDDGSLGGEDIFVWDKTTNYLGLGTATPTQSLHLYDAGNKGDLLIENTYPFITFDALSTTGNAGLIFKEQGNYRGWITYKNKEDKLYISVANSATAVPHIVVETEGNVGIGTATPDRKLTVKGTVGINDYIYHNGDDDTKMYMLTDGMEFTVGNEKLIDLSEGTQDFVKLGDGGDVDINLNDDLFVQGSNGNVGIGTTTPSRKLHVRDSKAHNGEGVIHSEYTGTTNIDAIAVYGNSTPATTGGGYGVGGKFYGGYRAVWAIAEPGTFASSTYGVYASNTGSNSGSKYGVKGIAYGEPGNTGTLYGVYGYADGVGGSQYAGYFSGNLHYTGILSGPSDRKLKSNLQSLNSVLSKVNDIKIYSYNYKVMEGMKLPKGNRFGFIAQELETLYPELVTENVHANESKGEKSTAAPIEYKGINYIGMIPILTKAIQEQQTIIEQQQQQINELIRQVAELK